MWSGSGWVAGIDPGYGMTGMVLVDHLGELVAYAAFGRRPGEHEAKRAVLHANDVIDVVRGWIDMSGRLRVGIETPVYTQNPATFAKQWRLVQEIEGFLMGMDVELVEVGPTTSKRVLTGSGLADKAAMVAASPFAGLPMPEDKREALADAWGHALAARKSHDVEDMRT